MPKRPDERGDRMKAYELVQRTELDREQYTIIRLDGRAFHTFTRGMQKPFDPRMIDAMNATMEALTQEVSGTKVAYTQSDEISLVLTAFDTPNTEMWFGGEVQKTVSCAASYATAAFLQHFGGAMATFDARVLQVPTFDEVREYLMWRQADCHRNAISAIAQARYSHKELQGVSTRDLRELLISDGHSPDLYPKAVRWGRVADRVTFEEEIAFTRKDSGETVTQMVTRTKWEACNAPVFQYQEEWLTERLPNNTDVLAGTRSGH